MSENDGVSNEYLSREKELILCPDNSAIIFKNRVYRILKKYTSTWYLHDYYESKHYCNDTKSSSYHSLAQIVIKISGVFGFNQQVEHCYSPRECINFPNIVMEYELIKDEDVPQKIIECIRRIQESKLIREIPMDKIIAHERQHKLLIKQNIDNYILSFMNNMFAALERSKISLEEIDAIFEIEEGHLTMYGCKILYDLPNSDGVYRKNFNDYLEYLLQQIYEIDGANRTESGRELMEADIHMRLCQEYPMLRIKKCDGKSVVDIKNDSLLH